MINRTHLMQHMSFRMETCYCQVLSEVTGNVSCLCDFTMQIITKKQHNLNVQVPVCASAAGARCLLNSACSNNFLAFSLHPSSAICFSDYFKIQVVCERTCVWVWIGRIGHSLCVNQVAAMFDGGGQCRILEIQDTILYQI